MLRSGIFSWDAQVDEAWERIKAIIALDIKLTIPQRHEQLVLTCDASKVAISAILWVEQNDSLRVVGCYSKLFSHTDSLKSIHFKETSAMVEAFKHYRPYLLARRMGISWRVLVNNCFILFGRERGSILWRIITPISVKFTDFPT